MTAQEKWERLTHPKTVDDYSLSMTRDELLEFDEGRAIVELWRGVLDKQMDSRVKMIAGNINQTVERVSYDVMRVYPLPK